MAFGQGFEQRLGRFAPGAHLVRSSPLQGGISAHMTVLEYQLGAGRLQHVVVREQNWGELPERRQKLQRELQTLRAVCRLELPAPLPYCVDVADDDGEPALLREYIATEPDLSPGSLPRALGEMARVLRRIHEVPGDEASLAFLAAPHGAHQRMARAQPGRARRFTG